MKKFKFKIADKFKEIAGLQVTQLQKKQDDYYLKISESEYSRIKDIIREPLNVLELGCGLGRFSIYLNSQLNYNPHFILADFSKISKKIRYGWNPQESYYNDLSLTAEFCEDNGLQSYEVFDLAKQSIKDLKEIDLVMSFLSVGFHYPIEQYIEDLGNITSDGAILIFGIRVGAYTEKSFPNFSKAKILPINDIKTKEEILILRK